MTCDVFGSGGGESLARELGVPLLGQMPLDVALRESGDAGVPLVVATRRHDVGAAIAEIAALIDESRVGRFTRTLPLVS